MMKSPQISPDDHRLKESAANQRERRESNFDFVFMRQNSRLTIFRYLLPLEGITGHTPTVIIAVRLGATSCVKSIKGPQELRRMEKEE